MKTTLTIAAVIAATFAQAGCATKIDLSNRVSRTEACDEVHVTSKWTKWFGFTTIVDEKDAAAILEKCKAERAKAAQQAPPEPRRLN